MSQPGSHQGTQEGSRPPRVLVLCDQPLTGEALHVALRSRGVPTLGLGAPRPRLLSIHVSSAIERAGVKVGLMLQERTDGLHLRESLRILREVTEIPWLVLSHSGPGPLWGASLEAGAHAVESMDIGLDHLEESLRAVAQGSHLVSQLRREALIGVWQEATQGQLELLERLERLSPREVSVLRGLAAGLPVAEIAERDGVHVTTVRSQVKSVLQKLELRSQLAAVAALQQAKDVMQVPPEHSRFTVPFPLPAE